MTDDGRELLRHTLATLAYRGGKALRGVPDGVARYEPRHARPKPIRVKVSAGKRGVAR